MRKAAHQLRWLLFLLALVLCMAASAAMADGATTVDLNDHTLTAASPYWKAGGGGSASDWNAYFDTTTDTPTLYLNNAVIDTVNSSDELIYADGDLHIVLLGTNRLSYTGTGALTPAGIYADGDLVFSDGTSGGTGELIITIDPQSTVFLADGILSDTGDVTIESGTIAITLRSDYIAYGLYAQEDLIIHGGSITVESTGLGVSAVSAAYVNMTSGSVTVTADGEFPDSHALFFYEMLLTGGTGHFRSIGSGFGALWDEPVQGAFRVSGGNLILQSQDQALFFYTEDTLTPTVEGSVYALEDDDGIGKTLWDSTKGALAGNELEDSAFRYVEFIGAGSQPNTRDATTPWLWLGVSLAAMLIGVGAYLAMKRKRNR